MGMSCCCSPQTQNDLHQCELTVSAFGLTKPMPGVCGLTMPTGHLACCVRARGDQTPFHSTVIIGAPQSSQKKETRKAKKKVLTYNNHLHHSPAHMGYSLAPDRSHLRCRAMPPTWEKHSKGLRGKFTAIVSTPADRREPREGGETWHGTKRQEPVKAMPRGGAQGDPYNPPAGDHWVCHAPL